MNSGFIRFAFALILTTGVSGTALAHEHGNSDSFKADPNYFSGRESCPKGFFWQKVVNKTKYHVRVFIDGKPFSTEIYSLSPKTIIREIDPQPQKPKELYHGAVRCFPEGKHEIKIIAFDYRKMPMGLRGVVEVLTGKRAFVYDSASDNQILGNPLFVEEEGFKDVRLFGWSSISHNIGAVFLILLLLFFAGAILMALMGLYKILKSREDW